MRRHLPAAEIVRHVDEHLVDGIDVDVLRRNIAEIDLVNAGADLHIARHARRRDEIAEGERGVGTDIRVHIALADEAAVRCGGAAAGVYLCDALDDLEKPGSAGDAVSFERGRHGEADGLLRAPLVRHDKVRRERIESAVHALHGREKRL